MMPFRDDPYQKILENYQLKAKELPQVSDDDLENVKQKQQYSTLANAVSQLVSSAGSFQGQQAKPMDFTQIADSAAQDLALKQQKTKLARDALNLDYNKEFETQRAADAKLSSERSAARQAEMDMFTREKQKQDLQKGNVSEGEKKLDADYVKNYNDWTSTGIPAATKNLDKLKNARKVVAQYAAAGGANTLSGNVTGRAPSLLRTEESRAIEQDVQSIAQEGLRAVLGAAFTDEEGKRIMKTSYDATLSPAENLKKIDATLKELEERFSNNMSKMRHFESNNYSLRGWRAPFQYADAQTPSTNTQTSPTAGGETKVINGKTYKKVKGGWEET